LQHGQFGWSGLAFALGLGLCTPLGAGGRNGANGIDCVPARGASTLDEIVLRVHERGVRYVFIGERHSSAAVKLFAVDLANALDDLGHDVGLYVEGFRVGCEPGDGSCRSLARLFNLEAFVGLLEAARVPVHAIDPAEVDRRAERMAAAIARGTEAIRVVLIGRSHVIHAGDPAAELWVYGGGVRYADPGDVVEAFPRDRTLTVTLETAESPARGAGSYALAADGCRADYALVATTPSTPSGG
jgi:hypothetical protein